MEPTQAIKAFRGSKAIKAGYLKRPNRHPRPLGRGFLTRSSINISSNKNTSVVRIIDANMNRLKEGLRVCEEITRFILNNRKLTSELKGVRHKVDEIIKSLPEKINMLKERKSLQDVGRRIYINELKRNSYQDIFFANIQRVKESIRVLEEFSKLKNVNAAIKFKEIRYGIYEIEKKISRIISAGSL
ncbi:MAG: hypothetical protein NTW64_04875 [Candidatus Omnitrophica bacterium]|nr:hypothetical protein [Candidatus Omnitrophota bacterium]